MELCWQLTWKKYCGENPNHKQVCIGRLWSRSLFLLSDYFFLYRVDKGPGLVHLFCSCLKVAAVRRMGMKFENQGSEESGRWFSNLCCICHDARSESWMRNSSGRDFILAHISLHCLSAVSSAPSHSPSVIFHSWTSSLLLWIV